MLQSKYYYLARPIELHYLDEIDNLIVTRIMMHNMMVKYHIEIMKGEEMANFYYDSTSQMENSDSHEADEVAVATGHNVVLKGLLTLPTQ